jgi:hypothetical protein
MVEARGCHTYAKQETDPDAVRVIGNCSLESFLVHYRGLREFFRRGKRFDDDLRATDYLPKWNPSDAWLSDDETDPTTTIARINKRLAHLSTMRPTLHPKWELDKLEQNALKTFEDFIRQLPAAEQLWFQKATELINRRKLDAPVLTLGPESASTASGSKATIIAWPLKR